MDLARAPRRTARKKGSGYENGPEEKDYRTLQQIARSSEYTDEPINRKIIDIINNCLIAA
jgi:hypothetical protein